MIKIFVLSIFEWPFKTGFTVSVRSVSKRRSATVQLLIRMIHM